MSHNPAQESLFQAWLSDHRGILAKVTRSFARTPSEAADLGQELLLRLWMSLPSFAGQAKPSTWIYRVCLNSAISWRRAANRRESRIDSAASIDGIAVNGASPADSAGDRDLLDRLYSAIHAMSDCDRALVLLMLDGLAYREIAEVTGLSENNVGVSLTRARSRLSAHMKGITDELE
jgi:RNA polymerase sigma-70 factor (ECF subfamily)